MNNKIKTILFTLVILMASTKAYAYDIEVKNADGVTIYYNYINDGKELEVVKGYYSGNIVIPEEVTYMNRTRKVTSIGNLAFANQYRLTSVTIPNSVTNIGGGVLWLHRSDLHHHPKQCDEYWVWGVPILLWSDLHHHP